MKVFFSSLYTLLLVSSNVGFTVMETASKYPSFVHIDVLTHSAHLFCGGTYIQEYWILTAAHCLDDTLNGPPAVGKPDRVTLYMGTTRQIGGPRQTRSSALLMMHDGYVKHYVKEKTFTKTKQRQYDIGLIKIHLPFNVNEHVEIAKFAAKLPRRPRLIAITYDLEAAELIGCQNEDVIIKCQEPTDDSNYNQWYNGGPLYLYDTKDVIGIFINSYNEEYGILITKYRSWIEDIFRLHVGDRESRGIESKKESEYQPVVRFASGANNITFNLLIFLNMLIILTSKCIY